MVALQINPQLFDGLLGNGGQVPEIVTDACLFFLHASQSASATILGGELRLVEE
jgi:hypothetical protein